MRTVDLERLEADAAAVLEPAARAYIERGSAGDETRAANATAWRALRLRPRVLRDVTEVKTETTVMGVPVAAPILVAPTAMHGVACTEGERATARAAAEAGSLMCVSMASSVPLDEIASAAPGAHLIAQMYMLRDRGRTRALAEGALGARAVMLGRPVLWGLAIDGEPGARAVLDAFAQDLRRTMAFCGAASLAGIDRDLLAP